MNRVPTPEEKQLASQGRQASLVIAIAAVLWVGAQWLGSKMGWPARYVFLFDLAAMAAFIWALVVTWRVWRRSRTQDNRPGRK